MNRAKIVFNHTDLRFMLDLADDVEIISLDVTQDPISLEIRFASDRIPDRYLGVRDEELYYIPLTYLRS